MLSDPSWRNTHNTLCELSAREVARPETDLSYHSSAEAFASMLTDMPYKILNAIISNLTLYFMSNLRREAGESTRRIA